ncbi:MAG: phosphoribosylglycinamide formyltransferase [Alphaproteobacteria bacterium]|nr:phosphoribosylglycinamide formyltransferase [Alphaproteobacteria bacterium]
MGVVRLERTLDLAVLISGRGSNLQAIIDACKNPEFPARIAVVISNKPDVYGLERARDAGIDTHVVPHSGRPKAEFEAQLHEVISDYDVNLICLAGFMRILSADFIAKWPNKIINIHPSLLPKHKGLDTHQRALEAGDTQSGCTVHYVVPEMDSGPIIVQKSVPILDGDTPDTLAARVLEQEHIAYPEAIKLVAQKRLKN